MMKIGDQGPITIRSKPGSLETFRHLPRGSRVDVKILDRTSATRAVIEMGGQKLNAEFLKGVPPGNRLSLILEKADSRSIVLRLPDARSAQDLMRNLDGFMITTARNIPPAALYKAYKEGLSGVFMFNMLLTGEREPGAERKSGMAAILNRLASMGVKMDDLAVFSYIFSSRSGIILNYLMPFVTLLARRNRHGANDDQKGIPDGSAVPSSVSGLVEDLERIIGEHSSEGREVLGELLRELTSGVTFTGSSPYAGSIPYLDDEFRELRYIEAPNALALSFDLSGLGHLEILGKDAGSSLRVDLFCEREEAKRELEKGAKDLARSLERAVNKRCVLTVNIIRHSVENIIEIISSLIFNGVIDTRA